MPCRVPTVSQKHNRPWPSSVTGIIFFSLSCRRLDCESSAMKLLDRDADIKRKEEARREQSMLEIQRKRAEAMRERQNMQVGLFLEVRSVLALFLSLSSPSPLPVYLSIYLSIYLSTFSGVLKLRAFLFIHFIHSFFYIYVFCTS